VKFAERDIFVDLGSKHISSQSAMPFVLIGTFLGGSVWEFYKESWTKHQQINVATRFIMVSDLFGLFFYQFGDMEEWQQHSVPDIIVVTHIYQNAFCWFSFWANKRSSRHILLREYLFWQNKTETSTNFPNISNKSPQNYTAQINTLKWRAFQNFALPLYLLGVILTPKLTSLNAKYTKKTTHYTGGN